MDLERVGDWIVASVQAGKPGVRLVASTPASRPGPADVIFSRIAKLRIAPRCRLFLLACAVRNGGIELVVEQESTPRQAGERSSFGLAALGEIAAAQGQQVVLLITGVGSLETGAQCEVLGALRRISSSQSLGVTQVIVVGHLCPNRIRDYWRGHLQYASPPFDSTGVVNLSGYSPAELEGRLERLMNDRRRTGVLAKVMFDKTGGDPRLVGALEDELANHGSAAPTQVEVSLFHLAEQIAVEDALQCSCSGLKDETRQLRILQLALRFHLLVLPADDLDCETLWSRGLIVPDVDTLPSGHRGIVWRPSSEVLAKALRLRWRQLLPDVKTPRPNPHVEEELLPEHHATVLDAAALVFKIENLARNLLTSRLGEVSSDNHPLAAAPAENGTSLFDLAALRKAEDEQRRPSNYLLSSPLVATLDTANLIQAFASAELYGRDFAELFPDKSTLLANLEKFNQARRAVAHSKPVSVKVLDALEEVSEFFETAIGRAGAALVDAVPLEIDAATARVVPTRPGSYRLTVKVANTSDDMLADVVVTVKIQEPGARKVTVLVSERLSFQARQRRPIYLDGDSPGVGVDLSALKFEVSCKRI